MKVSELLDILGDCDPDAEVVLAQDEEGNSHSPASFVAAEDGLVYSPEVRGRKRELITVEVGYRELTPDLEAVILVEDYDPFPVDAGALWGPAPEVPCMEPVPTDRFVAYEHRKLYGHNGVHALLGVLGKARGYTCFYEAGQDAELDALGRQAMWEEVGAALVRAHPEHFTAASMDAFASNLYARLVNPVFADEIERGARDTLRMIRPEDGRLAVAALFVAAQGIEPRAMCQGVAAALRDNGLGMTGLTEVLAEAEPRAAKVVYRLVEEALTNDSGI